MKRILCSLAIVALLLGTASAVLGSESTMSTKYKMRKDIPNAPWEPVLCMRVINPAVPDTSGIHALYGTFPTGADTTYTFSTAEKAAFAVESAKADGGRSLVITTCDVDGANNNDINAVAITITGTNALGATITTIFTPTDNTAGSATETTVTVFKTISTIKIVKMAAAGARVSVGFGTYWGLPITSPENTVLFSNCDGVRETIPTVKYSGTDLELNSVDFNTAENGTKDFSVHFVWPSYSVATGITKW